MLYGKTDAELLELMLLRPIGGGDENAPAEGAEGEGDAGGGKKPETPAGEGEEGAAKAPQTRSLTADDKGVFRDAEGNIFIPKSRLDEEAERREELEDRLEAVREEREQKLGRNSELSEEELALKADIERLFPGLAELPDFMAGIQAKTEREVAVHTNRMESRCNDFLGEVGLEASRESNNDLQDILGGRISRDPKLMERFMAGDLKVLDDVWQGVKKDFYSGRERPKGDQLAAATKRQLPKTPQKGAPPSAATPEGPKELLTKADERALMNKAHDDAWDRLNAKRGGGE
jgi:hypothetical protein